jgi:hypothetical protein
VDGNGRATSDGSTSVFSIPTGQSLVVTAVTVSVISTAATTTVRLQRQIPGVVTPFDSVTINTTAGAGSATLTYPDGSVFLPGTQFCVATASAGGTITFASAHGFLTAQ